MKNCWWGLNEPIAREKMQDMFNFRLKVVRSLFEKMGFEDDALEMRIHRRKNVSGMLHYGTTC